jgi:hypothetical protein
MNERAQLLNSNGKRVSWCKLPLNSINERVVSADWLDSATKVGLLNKKKVRLGKQMNEHEEQLLAEWKGKMRRGLKWLGLGRVCTLAWLLWTLKWNQDKVQQRHWIE